MGRTPELPASERSLEGLPCARNTGETAAHPAEAPERCGSIDLEALPERGGLDLGTGGAQPVHQEAPAARPAPETSIAEPAREVCAPARLPGRIAELALAARPERPVEVRLRLDPPSLGEIQVRIGAGEDGVTVRIVTRTPEAGALLAGGQETLRELLGRQGLALEGFSAGLAGDPGAAPRQFRQAPREGPRRSAGEGSPGPVFQAVSAPAGAHRPIGAALDMRV